MLDVGLMATLREVVRRGSFSAAAETLALSQPAVSRQVALLERRVGQQLVVRTRQGVQPTAAGSLLCEHADVIVGRLALAEEQLAELAGVKRGVVRMGLFFTALVHLGPTIRAECALRHPELGLEGELLDRSSCFRVLHAGDGEEPVEAQGLVAAGMGVTVVHELGVWLRSREVVAVRVDGGPRRFIQAALLREQNAPGVMAVLDVCRDLSRPWEEPAAAK